MNEHDTQPLTAEQVPEIPNAWEAFKNHPLFQAFQQQAEEENQHEHGPFTFLLNQNHNALRGCQSCGQTWVGLMAGDSGNLIWHPVAEPPEEENE